MVQHLRTTEVPWSDEVWVYFSGTQIELADLHVWCQANFAPDCVRVDTQDVLTMVDFGHLDIYRQAFVFKNKDDAVRFRLSW